MADPQPGILARLDRMIGLIVKAASVLVLPLSLLLFLQWPLRELVQAWSREANDLAQILFALYVSVGIAAATRGGTHLAADVLARRYPAGARRGLSRGAALLILLPWAGFVLWAATPIVLQSWHEAEAFAETLNPGFFLVKTAVALLALLVLAQAIVDALARRERA